MRKHRLFVPVLAIAALPFAADAQTTAADPTLAVDAVFERWSSDQSPGCAVGIAENGATMLARAYGMADLEHDVRNTPLTIFEAGSVSKQFTAAAIVLLALDGKLSLEDDVRKYVPEVPEYDRPITIRHMLTHTSGLRDWGAVAGISGWGRGSRIHTHDHMLDIVSRQSALNFEPGHEYSYSNTGYNLLVVVVDRVSGMPFAEFTKTRLFEPLGMSSTQWRDDYTRIVKGRAVAYSPRQGGFALNMPFEDVHGNGGLLTTVGDLLTWTENLETGELGGPEFLELMHRQGVLNDGSEISYASGLMVGTLRGVPSVSHTGSTAGYRAYLGRYPDQRLAVAILCNAGNANPGQLGSQVAEAVLGDALEPAPGPTERTQELPAPYAPAAEDLALYPGEYYSDDAETTLTIVVDGDRVTLHRRPNTRILLAPIGRDRYRSQLGVLEFMRDADGRVTELSVQQARVYDMRFQKAR